MSDYNPTYTVQGRDYETARKEREERPNPLSMELRIVLAYFWEMYNGCLKAARQAYRGGSEATPASYRAEAIETLAHARNLCHDLFDVTSPHAPVHIHSERGCNDKDCPAWKRGYGAAQGTVDDWCTHESRHGGLRSHVARR